MATLIALYGPQRVGKSTSAKSLENLHHFHVVSFAAPLYKALAAILGISITELRQMPKEEPLPALGGRSIRYALQTLGTEWGRELMSPDLWVITARRTISNLLDCGQDVVVDDLRFSNEYHMLRELNCRFVELRRHGLSDPGESHASEVQWRQFEPDAVVLNPQADDGVYWTKEAGNTILTMLGIDL